MIFGVNSAIPINKRLKNGYTLYDWIMRQKGFPEFCMRTLGGDCKLTDNEIDFLRNKRCKIALVFRDLTEVGVSGTSGVSDAERAVKAARETSVPEGQGIAIFADIRPHWSVNHNWMISFAAYIESNGYIPGFIGNTDSSLNFNFDRQCSHFIQATRDVNNFGAVYCATEPKLDSTPKDWSPYCPSALEPEDIHLWMNGTTTFDSIFTDDVYARNEDILNYFWEGET